MNFNVLIDSLVQQSMVMIGMLASVRGTRTPLAHLTNQVFFDLSHTLREHGLGQKVIADMFGITLRAYQLKVRRVSEGATERGRSLWESLILFLDEHKKVSHGQVLQHFEQDDSAMVASLLCDLVNSGIVCRSGSGSKSNYVLASADDALPKERERLVSFVWATIFRNRFLSFADLHSSLPSVSGELLLSVVESLVLEGRISPSLENGLQGWVCDEFCVPMSSSLGWEAAVFDHFQAMANAICAKAQGSSLAEMSDAVGGSTFHYDVDEEHPMHDEVVGFLERVRLEGFALQERLEATEHEKSDNAKSRRVTFYFGQNVIER